MVWRSPWRSTPPRAATLRVEVLVAQALTPLAPQVAALTTWLPQVVVHQTVTPVLHRLVACCWDLPASEGHHHGRPFGLLTHSLEVAQHALIALAQSSLWWAKAPDPAQRHRTEGHWRLGTVLAGLLHDLGKIFDVTVTLGEPGATWQPLQQPLLSWLLAHQRQGTLPTPTVTWQPGRGMRHETAGALAATLVLTRDDLVALTLPVARELWAYLGGVPDPANLFRQLLVQSAPATDPAALPAADGQSVRADLAAAPPAQPTRAAQVLTTLGQCCQEGVLRVNQFPGQVFVQEDATLVVVPAALDTVRQRLATTGIRLPGNTLVFHDLASAGYLLGTPGQNVVKAVFTREGKTPVTLAVLRLPHALLWGATPPPPYGGRLQLELPAAAAPEPTPAPASVAAP